jgi:hypothetical protein
MQKEHATTEIEQEETNYEQNGRDQAERSNREG